MHTPPSRVQNLLEGTSVLTRGIVETLSDEVVVLDADGLIIAANDAWRRFGCENGGAIQAGAVGQNYLEVCRKAAAAGDATAGLALDGITSVLDGSKPQFVMIYDCSRPGEQRTFALTVSPLLTEVHGAIVGHRQVIVPSSRNVQIPGRPSPSIYTSVSSSIWAENHPRAARCSRSHCRSLSLPGQRRRLRTSRRSVTRGGRKRLPD